MDIPISILIWLGFIQAMIFSIAGFYAGKHWDSGKTKKFLIWMVSSHPDED